MSLMFPDTGNLSGSHITASILDLLEDSSEALQDGEWNMFLSGEDLNIHAKFLQPLECPVRKEMEAALTNGFVELARGSQWQKPVSDWLVVRYIKRQLHFWTLPSYR